MQSRRYTAEVIQSEKRGNAPADSNMAEHKGRKLHLAMFPWFAMGHLLPYLHLSNQLAQRTHRISFLLPRKALDQLEKNNRHPDLITFHPITVPNVEGLPPTAETASDIPFSSFSNLGKAMDLTRDQVEQVLLSSKPDLVCYDFAHWIPEIASPLGIKSVYYCVIGASALARVVPCRRVPKGREWTPAEAVEIPPGYPSAAVVPLSQEGHLFASISQEFGIGLSLYDRFLTAVKQCDAIFMRTCREIEGEFCEYIRKQYEKPMLLLGPLLPEPADSETVSEDQWGKWLDGFKPGSVIYCAFGSQVILEKPQFQELVLAMELTGYPFLVALKPPQGSPTVEDALPEGFEERVKGRGMVYGGWIQQPLVLKHPSVGCFVSHCGFGSMWESLLSDCQIVLVPFLADQILNTRLLVRVLKVAVDVRRDEQRWFSKESLCHAIKSVMEEGSEVGGLIKKSHSKWKEVLGSPSFMNTYIDNFIENLYDL